MTSPGFTVLAVRYCADVPSISAFFETIGLTRRISSRRDGFVELIAGDGVLMLHAAGDALTAMPVGSAELSLEVGELDTAAGYLTAVGLDPVRWDESYGEHLGIRDPSGQGIWITEVQRDLYGYRAHDAAPNDLNVLAIRYSTDFAGDAAFFAHLGFRARPGSSEHFTPLEGVAASRGVIGLHLPGSGAASQPLSADNPVAPPLPIDIGFETHEPLAAVKARLDAAGVDAQLEGGPSPRIRTVDPEGVEVEIHKHP